MNSTRPPKIAVLGSMNMDLVIRCAHLPRPGETLLAESSAEICGGKGANQAVAAARAGGEVSMIGRVGDDAFADRLVSNLVREGIDCSHVHETENCASGLATVFVEESGENSIVVVPGANGRVSREDVSAASSLIAASDILLVQLEVPVETVVAAIKVACSSGVKVILDPAPAPNECPPELLNVCLLCPNESEAAAILGTTIGSVADAEIAARELYFRGARNVAITLGAEGTLYWDGTNATLVAPFSTTVVDTTAAGDAFAGALAVQWIQSGNLVEAIGFANAAGSLAASRMGAQPGLASQKEIEALWRTKR